MNEQPRREGILSAPLRQVGSVYVREGGPFTIPASGTIQIAVASPARVYLTAWAEDGSEIALTPASLTLGAALVGPFAAGLPPLVHMSTLPGLCQGEWWASGLNGTVVYVREGWWAHPQ